MRTKTINLYQFDELDDRAKERARDWYRAGGFDYEWWDYIYDDANTIAAALGFDLGSPPAIYFRGFSHQGDGACIAGNYRAERANHAALTAHVGDTESNRAILEIGKAFAEFATARPTFCATLTHTGRYSHEYSVAYECNEYVETEGGVDDSLTPETEEWFRELCRDFMRWIYRQLETEWDYMNSDEQVDESIIANAYEFDEDGHRA